MPNAGKTMMIVGGVLLAITVILSVTGYFFLSRGTALLTDPEDERLAGGTGNFTAYLETGKSYQVWTKEEIAYVEIMDPEEKQVDTDTYTMKSGGWVMAGEFTASVSGEYRFTMDPPDGRAMVTNEIDMAEDMEGNAAIWIFAIIGWQCATCLGPIAFLIMVAGVIVFFVEKSKRELATPPLLPSSFPPPCPSETSEGSNRAVTGMPQPKSGSSFPTPYGKKACLSCGLQIDLKYSICPYCEKPTSGKRSFWRS